MKNNYRKLKFSILLQTVLVTALTVLVGGFLLNYVIDGIYNDWFARAFISILTAFQVEEKTAIDLYWRLIGDNKTFFMVVGFLLLFALFFFQRAVFFWVGRCFLLLEGFEDAPEGYSFRYNCFLKN